MGDSDNAVPPSKKRVAGKQITQLDPEPDDDAPEPEMGTFQKASDEVLAARRIVKVRRHQSSSAPSSAPAPNPFAGIRLVPTTDSGAKATIITAEPQNVVENKASEEQEVTNEKPEKAGEEEKETNTGALVSEPSETDEKKKLEDETDESEVNDKLKSDGAEDANQSVLTGGDVEKEAGETEKAVGDETEKAGGEETDKGKQTDDPKVTAEQLTPVSSFHQLSSSQNAFTGLSGTGFSTSSFSFGGSFGKEGSTFGSGSFFGSMNGSPSFPSFGTGSSSINGSSSFPMFDTTKNGGTTNIPAMQDVPIETGEENEKAVFSSDAVLYEYLDGGWKERGKGELKVNISVSGAEKARLVMRSRGNYRLILNASLYPDMALTNMDKKGVTFACVNSAGEGKSGLTTFALKFRDSSFVEEFRGVLTAHKGKAATTTVKTPENSPKASDD